ncbi:MAG: DnaA N-terminal domain-containing protein [Terrisporobacter sp.]
MENNLQQFAYLLDNDNYMVENKIFIDLMWHIAKEKMVNTDSKGRKFLAAKSYVIRNAGVMFQQIFYWHFNAIKNGKTTKYKYKGINTIKMDFEDWWDKCRLTDKEVSTANKFLIDTGLISIQKMRIKQTENTFKPSNCYIINNINLEKYLANIIEINKNMYIEKVEKVRELNIKTSNKSKENTDLSTLDSVTPVTGVTGNIGTLDNTDINLSTSSTLSTDSIPVKIENNDSVTPVTGVTIVPPVTGVTIVPPVTGVTNKSNTSCSNTSYSNKTESTPPAIQDGQLTDIRLLKIIESKLTNVSFNTWFISGLESFVINNDKLIITTINAFILDIIKSRYLDIITESILEITNDKYNIELISIS